MSVVVSSRRDGNCENSNDMNKWYSGSSTKQQRTTGMHPQPQEHAGTRTANTVQLNRIVVRQFMEGLYQRYEPLQRDDFLSRRPNECRACAFMEVLLQRTGATRAQFKQVCCLLLKFIHCCHAEFNYMRHLHYDITKLIVAAFVLTEPNTTTTGLHRLVRREQCLEKYARVTGLSVRELTHCCAIVRPVLSRRAQLQRRDHPEETCTNGYLLRSEIHRFSRAMAAALKRPRWGTSSI